MKKRIFILFGLVLCLLLTSCNKVPAETTGSTASTTQPYVTTTAETTTSPKPNNPPITYHTTNYEIKKNGEQHYIFLETPEYYLRRDENVQVSVVSGIQFPSYDVFYDKVVNHKLTESDLYAVVRFHADDIGIRVCDFDNLSVPQYPEGVTSRHVSWEGNWYYDAFQMTGESYGYATFYPREEFENQMQAQPWADDLKHQAVIEERNADVFFYGNRQICVQYMLEDGDGTFLIRETYWTYSNKYEVPSVEDLKWVEVFYSENGRQVLFTLHDLEEIPTVEWLKGFGVEKYVPPVEE